MMGSLPERIRWTLVVTYDAFHVSEPGDNEVMGADAFLQTLSGLFTQYGYWALAGALLLENAGLPVPGETTLLFASFLAYSQHQLALPVIIVVGTVAATLGDNVGYAVGQYGGRRLLDRYGSVLRIRKEAIGRGEDLFKRRGALAVFFARFIAGMRIVAGPLAGVLHMPWKRFAIFNFLGAATWVTVIATVGYVFGSEFKTLVHTLGRAGWVLAAAVVIAFVGWRGWRGRRGNEEREARS